MNVNRRQLALSALLLGASVTLPGCNIATPIFFAVHGPGKVKKVTTLDEDRKYVIFIDDPANKVASRRLRSEIADTAQNALLQKGVVKEMIDGRSAYAAAANERYGEPLSIVEIGQSVGADVVIYALLTQFSLGAELGTYKPTAVMQVKIIDATTGEHLWPEIGGVDQKTFYPLSVTLPQKPGVAPSTTGNIYAAQEELAKQAGLALAQMFYNVEIPQSARRQR